MGDLIIMALDSSSLTDAIMDAASASGMGSAELSLNRLNTSVWTALRSMLAGSARIFCAQEVGRVDLGALE